jgi:hypothetical protein
VTARRLTRRQFLKIASAAGAVAVPTALIGYEAARGTVGEMPPHLTPYSSDETLSRIISTPFTPAPILILIDDRVGNPFGLYWSEIMRTEGLNCFAMARLKDMQQSDLAQCDVVLLAEQSLLQPSVQLLSNYVANGGRLIAMRPDKQLASLLGVVAEAGSAVSGYMQIDTAHSLGQGFTDTSLQFHGVADHYRLDGARAIAWLADKNNRHSHPAVTQHQFGRGQAALWAFDLARSIALTRQGNLARANQDLDGFFYVRAADIFVNWIDFDRMAIPQADEQQRLLAKLLTRMSVDRLPLPRLWYFPGAANSMLVATSDAHQNPAAAVEDVISRTERYGGHLSVYYLPPLYSTPRRMWQRVRWSLADAGIGGDSYLPTPTQINDWRARGHEFTLHPEVASGLEEGWQRYWEGFTGLGWGPITPSARTHAVLWTGWVESARVQASYGIRLNHDYYQIGPMFRDAQGRWLSGYFTGSGLPMRFVDEQGRILNVLQQVTQLADDHLVKLHWNGVAELSAADALAVAHPLLERSLTDHSVVTMQFHTDPYAEPEPHYTQAVRWLEGSLDYARSKGIPIWNSLEWLRFWEARHGAVMDAIHWSADTKHLAFDLRVEQAPSMPLTVMVPVGHQSADLVQVLVDGNSVKHDRRELRGETYAWFTAGQGTHHIEAKYA